MSRRIVLSPVRPKNTSSGECWSMSPVRRSPSNDTPNVQAGNQFTESTARANLAPSAGSSSAEPPSPSGETEPDGPGGGAQSTISHPVEESKRNEEPRMPREPDPGGLNGGANPAEKRKEEPGMVATPPPTPPLRKGMTPTKAVCRSCVCVALLALLGIFIVVGIVRMNSNTHDDCICGAQNNESGPSTPDDTPLRPSTLLDAVHPSTTPRSPTEEPALDFAPTRVQLGDEIVVGDAAERRQSIDTYSPLGDEEAPDPENEMADDVADVEAAAEGAGKTMDLDVKKSGYSLPPHLTRRNPHVGTSRVQSEISCWVYMHMDKSGANFVRNIITERWQDDQRNFDSVQWRRGDDYAVDVMTNSRWRLLHGGCVEALRRYEEERKTASEEGLEEGDSCAWFTVFRNPVARMISAFDHCQKAPRDPLCGPVQATDLEHFAEYWGNFGLRQFTMALVLWSDVKGWAARPGGPRDRSSTWYLLKQYFNRQSPGAEISEEMFLEPAKEILSTAYTAIGIEENMEATMTLFNKALSMPNVDWVDSFRSHPTGEQDGDVVEAGRVEAALANPRIVDALTLDISLYEHAVAVFREQVAL